MPAGILGQLIASGQISTSLSIVTTDYDFHGIWLDRTFSRYFVALDETKAHCCALGLPEERVIVSGIPVDPAFEEPFDRAALLAKYELHAESPIILVSAGAAGNNFARQVAEQLMLARQDLQVVVVCGRNVALRREIEALVEPQTERFHVLGFTDQMPDLMRLATLFIGKPGGPTPDPPLRPAPRFCSSATQPIASISSRTARLRSSLSTQAAHRFSWTGWSRGSTSARSV
jgi:processive 1,2-diacylglycerol beta-glucosyltransferase